MAVIAARSEHALTGVGSVARINVDMFGIEAKRAVVSTGGFGLRH
jgi:hypothetical protein